MELYERIASLCGLEGINVTQLCRQTGVSRGALSDLKAGRKASLSAGTLAKLAAFFGVSVDFLLTGAAPAGQMVKTRTEDGRRELAQYFSQRMGRLPRPGELARLEEYIGIFLRSLG